MNRSHLSNRRNKTTGLILATALFASIPQLANAAPITASTNTHTAVKSVVKSVAVPLVTSVKVRALDQTSSNVEIKLKKTQAGKTVKAYVANSRNGTYVLVGSHKLDENGNTTIGTRKDVNVGKYLKLKLNGKIVYSGKVTSITKAPALVPTFQNEVMTNDGFTLQIANFASLKSRGITPTVATSKGSAVVSLTGLVTVSGLDFAYSTTLATTTSSSRYETKSTGYTFNPVATSVATESELLAALATTRPNIRLTSSITLSSPLIISGPASIAGASSAFAFRNNTVTVSSGPVVLKDLTLPTTTNYFDSVGGSNYGVMVSGGSLVADNVHLTVSKSGDVNNVGFSVQSGASLKVMNSELNIDKWATSGSYAVYAQNGAQNITLTNNALNMAEIGSGATDGFTYLLGTEGALGIQGTVSVSGNTGYVEVTMLVADQTAAVSQGYASWLPNGGILRVISTGQFFKQMSGCWGAVATNTAEFDSALADSSVNAQTIYLQPGLRDGSTSIALSGPLNIDGPRTIDGVNGTSLTGNTVMVNSGLVELKNLTLPISTNTYDLAGLSNYGVMVMSGSLTADNLTLTVDAGVGAADGNNVGFTVQPNASLIVQNSDITTYKRGGSGSYTVYAQSGSHNVTMTNNTLHMIEVGSGLVSGYTQMIGTEGPSGITGTVTVSGNTGAVEVTSMVALLNVSNSETQASWVPVGGILRVLSTSEFFVRTAGGWNPIAM
jgi:hypothetical protein